MQYRPVRFALDPRPPDLRRLRFRRSTFVYFHDRYAPPSSPYRTACGCHHRLRVALPGGHVPSSAAFVSDPAAMTAIRTALTNGTATFSPQRIRSAASNHATGALDSTRNALVRCIRIARCLRHSEATIAVHLSRAGSVEGPLSAPAGVACCLQDRSVRGKLALECITSPSRAQAVACQTVRTPTIHTPCSLSPTLTLLHQSRRTSGAPTAQRSSI